MAYLTHVLYQSPAKKMVSEPLDFYESIDEAIKEVLTLWHETEDNFRLCFVTDHESGKLVATLGCGESAAIVTVTRYDTIPPTVDTFRVTYLCDKDGKYESTEIISALSYEACESREF